MKRQYPKEVQELLGYSGVAVTLDTCSYVILNREEGDNAMEEPLS